MAELDSLIDSLMLQQNGPEVSYIDERYATALALKQTPSSGQGVFAEQFLSVRNPICSLNYPTMMAIDSDFIPTTCYHCLIVTTTQLPLSSHGITSIALKTCNGCLFARFCSKECQVQAWHAYHKFECKIFKRLQPNPPATATLRAVMRTVLLQDRNLLPSEDWSRITGLISHEQVLAARGRTNLTDMAEGIKHLTASSMSTEAIQRLIFIMKSNATELPTSIHGGIGVMLDPFVAKLNHSCEPNISIHRRQHTMAAGWMNSKQLSEDQRKNFVHVIPLRDIQAGEELLNCYAVPTISVNARKKKLREDYFFDCDCPKCQSDLKGITNLAESHPSLPARYEQWTVTVIRQLSRITRDPHAVHQAATAMYKSDRFLEHPVLYTTGDFPQMAMGLIKEGLKGQAFDEALVNVLRVHFLVNPERFVGRHNPTNLYTTFLLLDIFDAVLGISTPPAGVSSDDRKEQWRRNLSGRGLSKQSLIYWRHRLCADLRKRVEESATTDLLVLVEKSEEQMQRLPVEEQAVGGEESKTIAEQEMRSILGLSEPRWQTILQNCGC